ncbi:MAG: VWA domain-containing protein [Candidatus Sulfopaludibacter sp.]|nr:VWA domain-containing protein [Candidatus Sulfopaludibacter sp.]
MSCHSVTAAAFMKGKVRMEDGSSPPARVLIQRVCPGASPLTEGWTDKRGYYLWSVIDNLEVVCVLKAVLAGYESNTIDTSEYSLYFSPVLPTLVLHPAKPGDEAESGPKLPRAAAKPWDLGMKALTAKKWAEAEILLRRTVQAAPAFAPAWNALGAACQYQQKTENARESYRQAITVDPGLLSAHVNLTRLEIASQHWPEAMKTAGALIQADKGHVYLEAYLDDVIARYALHDLDGAEATLAAALPLDKKQELPRLEYFMGAVLGAKGDPERGAEHLRKYLALAPRADDAPAVRAYLDDLDKANAAPLPLPAQKELLPSAADPNLPAVGDAWVPGGLKALSAMARLKVAPSRGNFFLEYCRAIAIETSKTNEARTPGYSANLEAYMAAVAELTRLGEQRGDKAVVTLSLADSARVRKTRQVLPLLGWRVVEADGTARAEPGDQSADEPRQQIPAALGIDELAMQRDLESGKSFRFEIPSENASLIGGVAWWGTLVQGFSAFPGELAEAFERDPRLAKTYAALAAMPADAAKALVASIGLRDLAAVYSDRLWLYSDTFSVASGAVAVPGGVEAEKVWAKLAGANPHNPPAFLRAVLASDRGRVAAFYSALAHADSAHQQFFLKSSARAQRFYAWYRDSDELRDGIARPARSWRPDFFQKLPLDGDGKVRFPGGKAEWTNPSATDEDALLHLSSPEALLAIAELEEKRGARFDDASARLLVRHFTEWHPLFPYFEVLPGLGRAEFEALETFSKTVAGYRRPVQNLVAGEWHSLMALIVLGRKAGSLDDATAVRAFRHTCEGLLVRDYSAKALDVLREISGRSSDLDDAVADGLLRLGGPERSAFERVRELQGAPRLDDLGGSPSPEATLGALAGLVYGAVVNPDSLLISEDPALMNKHQYVPNTCGTCTSSSPEKMPLFSSAKLLASAAPAGTRVIGGFMHFDGLARNLISGGRSANFVPAPGRRVNQPGDSSRGGEATPTEAVFRTTARLVQVFATITDSKGRYVDGLTREQFTLFDNGKVTPVTAFESETSDLSLALLLDTTESMQASLPALKRAALKIIGSLRSSDSVAVYALSGGLTELQPFTTDKDAAARSVLKTEPGGLTALYDGLVRVARDIAGRTGKKAIVVFTDGDDNISTLPAETAILRAKATGVPIYTIARGTDLHEKTLGELAAISQSTGGTSFTLHASSEIGNVFEKVFQDLMHGYVLAFQPAEAEGHDWRPVEVVLKDPKGRKVRARDGYYPE